MTSFLRFFVLALTPLLGVTGSWGPAFLFGLVATLLLAGVSILGTLSRGSLPSPYRLWAALGLATLVVTAVDGMTSVWLPGVRSAWGPYLTLLAFSPLILLPTETEAEPALVPELLSAVKIGLGLTGLLLGAALVRETLGHGTLTLVPGQLGWDIVGLKEFPLTLLATGAGGFFLAALGVVLFRLATPPSATLPGPRTEVLTPVPVPPPVQAKVPLPQREPKVKAPTPPKRVEGSAPASEPAGEWGETLPGAVADLASNPGNDKYRLLVIGSGNGELAYYLAMLGLDQAKAERGFSFRVRGVDHFATRVETALRGTYRDHQIDFIPASVRDAWLTRGEGEDKYLWKVKDELKVHVQFEVADFQKGTIFFPQPSHIIVLNQGIEYVVDDKKVALLKTVCDQLAPGGALVVPGPLKRELLPEGMKRTGTTVFRKG